jgi:hypothetical protein
VAIRVDAVAVALELGGRASADGGVRVDAVDVEVEGGGWVSAGGALRHAARGGRRSSIQRIGPKVAHRKP